MKRLLLLLAIWFLAIPLFAERVDVNTAQTVAVNLAKQIQKTNSGLRSFSPADISLAYTASGGSITSGGLRNGSDEADFYAFNMGSEQGFVIISGEDRVRPVIGYSTIGEFKVDGMPDHIKSWLEHYQEEITFAIKNQLQPSDKILQEWQDYKSGVTKASTVTPVQYLETAEWDQGAPYYNMCPPMQGKQALTGCVATAQAIVMNYHKYPVRATGGVKSYAGISITYDNYDWNNMLMKYKSYNNTQANAVAKLMFHCGANVEMEYSPEGSGAVTALVTQSLIKNFGYDKQSRFITKERYKWDEWKTILNQELDAERPVIYSARSDGGGHAFICDGYTSDGAYHINWGWSGYLNGYFLLSTLDSEGDGHGYSQNQAMAIGIQPAVGTDYVYALRLYNSISSPATSVQQNTTFNLKASIINEGSADFEGFANAALVDKNYTVRQLLCTSNIKIKNPLGGTQYYYLDLSLECTPTIVPNPTDKVVIVYSRDGDNWEIAKGGSDMATEMSVTSGVIQPGKDDPDEPEAPLNISMFSNGFDSQYVSKGSSSNYAYIGFTSSNLTIPVCFRYRLKDASWRSKIKMTYGTSWETMNSSLNFGSDGIAWMDADGHKVSTDQIINYVGLEADATGTMEYEIAVYDPSKTTQYAKFDCSVRIINPVRITLSEIKGAKNTDIPFTLTVTNPGDFSGKQVKIQVSSSSFSKENTTIKYINGGTPETITLSNPYQGDNYIEGEHTLSSLATTTYNYIFRSTSKLSKTRIDYNIIDASNNLSIPYSVGTSITISDEEVPTPPEEITYSPLQITNQGGQIGIVTNQENMSKGSSCNLIAGSIKLTTGAFEGYVAAALTTGDNKIKEIISTPYTLNFPDEYSWYSSCSFYCHIVNSTVETTDLIRLVSSTGSSTTDLGSWSIIDGENNKTTNFIKAKGQEISYHQITLPTVSGVTVKSLNGNNADKVVHGWYYQFAVIPDDPSYTVVVRIDGKLIKPNNTDRPTEYYIDCVLENKNITVEVFDPSQTTTTQTIELTSGDLKNKFTPLELACIKELTIKGTMDTRDFLIIRDQMFSLEKLNLSDVTITANENNPANGIPAYAFYVKGLSNTTLTSIIFPNSLTSINSNAFISCNALVEITIPEKVTTYGVNVFNACRKLTNVTVKNPEPAHINWCVFNGSNRANGTLTVPVGSKAEYQAASEWNLFGAIVEASSTGYKVTLPTVEGIAVTPEAGFDPNAITAGQNFKFKVTPDQAHANWIIVVKVNDVQLTADQNGIYTIDNIQKDQVITVSLSDPSATDENFTSGLLNYQITSSTTVSITGTTDDMQTEYTIPSTVSNNGKSYNVTAIGTEAFNKCENLKRFTSPTSLDTIGKGAFAQCTALNTILLKEGLLSIGDQAFEECTSLNTIEIPASVTFIGELTFMTCSQLSSIIVNSNNANYASSEGVLYDKAKKTLLAYPNAKGNVFAIPQGVTRIGVCAFVDCTITEITIPEGVTSIGEGAFENCKSLQHVTFPASLSHIDKEGSIFINCEETLKEIHFTNPVPFALEGDYPEYTFFYDSNLETGGLSKCVLYVPKGSKETYADAPGWKYFKNIQEEETDLPAKPLVPITPETDITIGNDHTYTDSEGNSDNFNGTVGTGNQETVINKLTINSTESTATSITFNWVTIGNGSTTSDAATTITQTSNVLINLLGRNSFDTLINNGTVTLSGNTNATLFNTTIINKGIFTDKTGLITQVEGDAGLDISAPTDQEVSAGQSVSLEASTEVGTSYSLTFTWEQLQPDGSWKVVGTPNSYTPTRSGLRIASNKISDKLTVSAGNAGETATYRCVINNKVDHVSTTLLTQPATVTVKSTVDNAVIDQERKAYVRDRVLYIQVAVPTKIKVINFNGQTIKDLRLPVGETRIDGLQQGFYIIQFEDNQTIKISI